MHWFASKVLRDSAGTSLERAGSSNARHPPEIVDLRKKESMEAAYHKEIRKGEEARRLREEEGLPAESPTNFIGAAYAPNNRNAVYVFY